MKRCAVFTLIILILMSMGPVIAQIPSPNSTSANNNTLSIDGFVNTKFASVGSDVEIMAHTRGHTYETQVTADILRYDMDPIDVIGGQLPLYGEIVSTIVLQKVGPHESDANTMTWKGIYTVPVSSNGGVFGASIKAENSAFEIAVDDSTQITKLFLEKFESMVLKPLDDAWDSANPLEEIKSEFESLEEAGTANEGWSNFVYTATKGSGPGGSQQLWNSMIDAGKNQYDLEAGANFLEALMEFLDSEDVDAGLMMITGLLLYGDEFPLPRSVEDLEGVIDYVQMFDPIENFTRFEGTGDFEAAYNALLGSDEWNDLQESLDNLANNQLPFQSIQNILRNLALLAVSDHPEAIINALEAWVEPLSNQEIDSMTPIQKLIIRMSEMNVEVQDLNGDEVLDDVGEITWEYELLMDTSEGQAWTAKMETSSPWVNDAFDNFNSLPEDIVGHIFTSLESPVWNNLGESLEEFGEWIEQSSTRNYHYHWWNEWTDEDGDGEDDDQKIIFGDNCDISDEDEETDCIPEIEPIVTSVHDRNFLELGVEVSFNPENWDTWEDHRNDVPDKFTIAITNEFGDVQSTDLVRGSDYEYNYLGLLSVPTIEDSEWSFTQPLINFIPPCDDCRISSANLEMEKLFPTLIESMAWENNDESFIISAVGVLVTQEETTLVNRDYNVVATAYSHDGPVENAEIDMAILRVSPQAGAEAAESLSLDGEFSIDVSNSNTLNVNYDGNDINGDLEGEINPRGYSEDNRYFNDQLTYQHSYQSEYTDSQSWRVNLDDNGDLGIAEVITKGKTESGIEFEIKEEFPMPGTPDCIFTSGRVEEQNENEDVINLQLTNQDWQSEKYYNTPDFEFVTINWGDGSSIETIDLSESVHGNDHWRSHNYDTSSSDNDIYEIEIEYTDENENVFSHHFKYRSGYGFETTQSDEDEDVWYDWYVESAEGGYWDYCRLDYSENNVPSPEIIDSFITDGPFEVMKEEIMTSDNNGETTMTVSPTLPGAYISIAQAKVTRANGEQMVGIGMNLAGVTSGSISIGGDLTQETTFGGIPVYKSERGDLSTGISITPTDIPCENGHKILAVLSPLDLSEAFPEVPKNAWGTGDTSANDDDDSSSDTGMLSVDLDFECGETSKNWEVGLDAPMYVFGIIAVEGESSDDGSSECYNVQNGEYSQEDGWFYPQSNSNEEYRISEGEMFWDDGTFCPENEVSSGDDLTFPKALHIGIVINNPDSLKLTGDLGPGQTTNIALSDEDGPASRILAVATPKEGFDPATIDFSAFTEFIYGEGVRNNVGWIAQEEEINKIRVESDVWCEDRNDYNWEAEEYYGESNVRVRIQVDTHKWSKETPPSPTNSYLKDSLGSIISPVRDWYQEWEGDDNWYANYKISDSGDYKLTLDSHINDFFVDLNEQSESSDFCNSIENGWEVTDGENQIDTQEEVFELIDNLLSNVDSIAWGLGSSADLHLPILSSPVGEYTILAIAQKGEGDSAVVVSAINNEVIVPQPNPEPPKLENMYLSFSPPNPQVGDTVTINVIDENNAPIDGVSVTGKKDSWTIFSMVTNEAGQAEFVVQLGVIDILASGGNYNPASLTINVTDSGVTTEDGENLPDEENPLSSGEDIDETTNQTLGDNINEDKEDAAEDESGTGTGLRSGLGEYENIFYAVIAILVVVIVILLSVMKIRGRTTSDWEDEAAWDDYQEIINSPNTYDTYQNNQKQSADNNPPNYIEGQWRDGYEVLEYPTGSGNWWYRDGQSGQWMEWR